LLPSVEIFVYATKGEVRKNSKMSLDLQEAQRTSIIRMLQLKVGNEPESRSLTDVPQWKVLIYDRPCQDVVAPILKVR